MTRTLPPSADQSWSRYYAYRAITNARGQTLRWAKAISSPMFRQFNYIGAVLPFLTIRCCCRETARRAAVRARDRGHCEL
ncbi:hypothetical protein KCP71_11605 [Salmonella enterica subsp. enterica]|nr:hypothetical protein KCP71_11605 [Salmonella enterica subsp. enterica]